MNPLIAPTSLIFIPSLADHEDTLPTLRSSGRYYQIRHKSPRKDIHTLCVDSRALHSLSRGSHEKER